MNQSCSKRYIERKIKLTNNHVEELDREVGEPGADMTGLRSDVSSLISYADTRFDLVDTELRDTRSEVILQANQIINAQQQAMRAMMRLDDIEQPPAEPRI